MKPPNLLWMITDALAGSSMERHSAVMEEVAAAEAELAAIERRSGAAMREILAADTNVAGEVAGYAAVFGSVADGQNGPTVFERGAFARSLREEGTRVLILWAHQQGEIIGKPSELREDDHGLFVRAKIANTSRGREAMALAKGGIVRDLSVGFSPRHSYMRDGVRHVTAADIFEISVVGVGADAQAKLTEAAARAAGQGREVIASTGGDVMTAVAQAEAEAARLLGGGEVKPTRNVGAIVAAAEHDAIEILEDKDGVPASVITTEWLTGIADTPERRLARWQSRQQAAWHAEGIAEQQRLRHEREVLSLRGGRRWL